MDHEILLLMSRPALVRVVFLLFVTSADEKGKIIARVDLLVNTVLSLNMSKMRYIIAAEFFFVRKAAAGESMNERWTIKKTNT